MKFKVGDKVRCVDRGHSLILRKGHIYTIKAYNQLGAYCIVKVEEIPTSHSYCVTKFELASIIDQQAAMCKTLYGSDSIKSPNDSKPLAETESEAELPDYEQLAEESTKRLTPKEMCDIMDAINKLTWHDFK